MEFKPTSAEDYIEMGARLRTPSAPPLDGESIASSDSLSFGDSNAHSYRLQSINQMLSDLESIKDERERLVKKYKKYRCTVHNIDVACAGLAVASTAAGLAVLSTIVGAPIAIGVQSVGLGFGAASVLSKYAGRRLGLKLKKHQKILELCQNTILGVQAATSHAISNGHVSEDQYKDVLGLRQKFDRMKRQISHVVSVELNELEQRNVWMEQGHKEALEQLQKNILTRKSTTRRKSRS